MYLPLAKSKKSIANEIKIFTQPQSWVRTRGVDLLFCKQHTARNKFQLQLSVRSVFWPGHFGRFCTWYKLWATRWMLRGSWPMCPMSASNSAWHSTEADWRKATTDVWASEGHFHLLAVRVERPCSFGPVARSLWNGPQYRGDPVSERCHCCRGSLLGGGKITIFSDFCVLFVEPLISWNNKNLINDHRVENVRDGPVTCCQTLFM